MVNYTTPETNKAFTHILIYAYINYQLFHNSFINTHHVLGLKGSMVQCYVVS